MTEDALAIVGLACRFPGAVDARAFWRLLISRGDAIREVPPDRWDAAALHDPRPGTPGKISTRFGAFLDGIDEFDPQAFGLSPREAETMEPQQRLALELGVEALQDAGIAPGSLAGSATGVFMGFQPSDYYDLLLEGGAELDAHLATGNSPAVISNRLSYLLDLRGPSLSVDTACSSALVALHLAARSLRSGESSLAIVGGVNLVLAPYKSIALSQAQMLAPDGRCKTFDARADGYVRSEGCGVVIVERLADAERLGHPVWALLRGTAVQQDGRSNGLTAPSGPAQTAVIRAALADARVSPDAIGFVETHGTGTALGDPIEVQALGAVFGARRGPPVRLGAVKTNVGHLESAAGIAGLIKAVLALHEGLIPANLHLERPNPNLGLERFPFELPTTTLPWARGATPRLAGVSSFGFGGTNAHAVLEEAPAPRGRPAAAVERGAHVLALSARTPELVEAEAASLAALLADQPWHELGDVAFTLHHGRDPQLHRAAIVARSLEEAEARLGQLAAGEDGRGLIRGQRRRKQPPIAFLFSGQGAQVSGMGRAPFETEPVFRRALERCAAIADPLLGRSLLSLMFDPAEASALHATAHAQIALFALEHALAAWWVSLGVEPALVLGHSLGELSAATFAGSMALEDAIPIVVERGRLMQSCGGVMASVFAPPEVVERAIAEHGGGEVDLAAVNEPEHVVVSGRAHAVARVTRALESRDHVVRVLKVSGAFHSLEMDPVLAPFRAFASGVPSRAPSRAWITALTGQAQRAAPDAEHWVRHLREPVRFLEALRSARNQGVTAFLEIGPAATLVQLGRRALADDAVAWIPSLAPGGEAEALATAAATLWTAGVELDWRAWDAHHARESVRLPPLPYARRRLWFTPGVRAGAATLLDRLRAHARARPNSIAVIDGDARLTYAELVARASPGPGVARASPSPGAARLDLTAITGLIAGPLPPGLSLRAAELGEGPDPARAWLAVSTDAVLTALLRGETVLLPPPAAPAAEGLEFSLCYFAAEDLGDDAYGPMLDGARFADAHGFRAVWIQEQHFHAVGGPYPNPAIAAAAIATTTRRIALRGSIRLPLHHPIRVAEDWAMVDRLAHGRVGLAFSSSLDASDYVFGQAAYDERNEVLLKNLGLVRGMWRGQKLTVRTEGRELSLETRPRPVQSELPFWVNAGCEDARCGVAAELGASILVPLAAMRPDELGRRIELYREAWARAGHAGVGHVTVLVHTQLGDDLEAVRELVREPMTRQLRLNAERLAATSADPALRELPEATLAAFARSAFEQHFERGALFGTPETVRPKVELLAGMGVDELACLIDFGVEREAVLGGLSALNALRREFAPASSAWSEGLSSLVVLGEFEVPGAMASSVTVTRLAVSSVDAAPVRAAGAVAPAKARVGRAPEAPPRTPTEQVLAQIWCTVLRLPGVSIHDDFFALGGDSRLAIEIIARARAAGLTLDALRLIERPTIAQLAESLEAGTG